MTTEERAKSIWEMIEALFPPSKNGELVVRTIKFGLDAAIAESVVEVGAAKKAEISRLNSALEERRAAFTALNQDDLRLSEKFLKLREELKEQTLEAEGWRLMSEQRAVELEMALDEKKEAFIKKDIKGWRARCWRSEDAHELTKTRLERALTALHEAKSIDLNYRWQADVDAILAGDGNV